MQAIATPQALSISPMLLLTLLLPGGASAQQPERYTLTGDEVAVYNLAGEVRGEPGPGPTVTAELTRGGADAAKLKVLRSEVDGRNSLRLQYPADRIQYAKLSEGSPPRPGGGDSAAFAA